MTFSKVVKSEQLERLYEIEQYSAKLKQEAEDILAQAKSESAQIRQGAYDQGLAEANQISMQLIEQTYSQIDSFLQHTQEKLFDVVKDILVKLGVSSENKSLLTNLIRQELKLLYVEGDFNIYTHSQNLDRLAEELSQMNMVKFYADDSLSVTECLLQTKLFNLRISIDDLLNRVFKLLVLQ